LKVSDVPRYEDVVLAVKRAYVDWRSGRFELRDLALVAFLAFTGCRLEEALGVARGDLDFEGRAVRLRRSVRGRVSERVVDVPARLFWDIMSLYTRSLDGDRLFPFHSRYARAVVYRWSERYLGRRVRPHALRHSYALYLLEKTGSLELVRRMLGHTSLRWVKVYGQVARVEPRDLLAEAFKELRV